MTDQSQSRCPFGFGAAEGATPGSFHAGLAPAMARNQLPKLVSEPLEPGAEGLPTGRCLCGGVSYRLLKPVEKVFANHDEASRRWTGGIALTVVVRATGTEFHGWGNIVQYAASDRDRHCFCRLCGTSLFVRHVAPAAMDGC